MLDALGKQRTRTSSGRTRGGGGGHAPVPAWPNARSECAFVLDTMTL